jgi:hypothetical protein
MNHHTEIEQLRQSLLHDNQMSHEQRLEGYQRLRVMIQDYLATEGV